jgi:hypothetical protein
VAPKQWWWLVPGGDPLGAVESAEDGTDVGKDVDEADRADAG